MKPWTKSVILLPVFVTYIFLGAYAFLRLEQARAGAIRSEFFGFLVPFSVNKSRCVSSEELLSLLEVFSTTRAMGVSQPSLVVGGQLLNDWSWSNSIVFASTIVTTVGYGRLVPHTVGGQIFGIAYAIIGIPLCYTMLSVVGDTFQSLWQHSFRLFDKAVACFKSRRTRKLLGALVTVAVLWLFLVMIPAAIFAHTESWSMVDAQYFSFVSLSTIGFGDLVYGMEDRLMTVQQDWLYKIGMLAYFLIGLSVISIVFKGLWRAQKERLKRARKTTRQFWQNRAGRHRSYSLGTPQPLDAGALQLSGLFRRKRSTETPEPILGEQASEEHEMERTMAADAMELTGRRTSVFSLSYRSVTVRRVVADQDSGHGSCNNSFMGEDGFINSQSKTLTWAK